MITLEQYVTANDKYPERLKHQELTDEIKKNAEALLNNVNDLLKELKIEKVTVSSGWRPSDTNSKIPNAAKKSLHMEAKAVDILDIDGKLDQLIENNDELLKKYGIWQESPLKTRGWVHLDCKNRGKRAKNQFSP